MTFSFPSLRIKNQWLRRAVWLVGGVVGLWLLAWLGTPPLLKSQLQSRGSEALGRTVTVGQVDFKPWTLALEIKDLSIATQDGASSQLAIQRLYIDAEMESLFRLAPVVKALEVDAPNLKLTHLGDGKYDIDDVIERLNPAASNEPKAPEDGLAPFALFNVALKQGSVDFVDRAVNQTHQLRGLDIGIPFLNNLASHREVVTEPRLAFQLNGSAFDSAAQTTPFAQSRKTDATISLAGFDLKPYLGYIPASLPMKLVSGVLSADVKVAFEQTTQPTVTLSGQVELVSAQALDRASQALLSFDSLKVSVDELRPLAALARLSEVSLSGAVLAVRRDKMGQINWLQMGEPNADSTIDLAATKDPTPLAAAEPAEPAAKATGQEADSPWKVEVSKLELRDATVNWTDDAPATQVRLGLKKLAVDASNIAWPFVQPLQFSGAAQLVGLALAVSGESDAPGAALAFRGSASDQEAQVAATLEGLPLDLAEPYMAAFLQPTVGGRLSADLALQWAAGATLALDVKQLTVDDLALLPHGAGSAQSNSANKGAPLASVGKLSITDAKVDLNQQGATIGKLAVLNPKVALGRGKDQRWMFESWLLDTDPAEPSAKPWALVINEATLDNGAVSFEDLALPGKPVKLSITALKLAMKNTTPEGAKPASLNLSGQVKAAQGEPGEVDYKGTLAWAPLAAQGSLLIKQLPVQAFEPYFGDALNIELLRADAGFKGELHFVQSPEGLSAKVSGDVVVGDVRANSVAGGVTGDLKIAEELLSWKTLSLRGLAVDMAPGVALKADVQETALSDFYARVIVNPSGRINLQDVVKPTAEAAEPGAADPPVPLAGVDAAQTADKPAPAEAGAAALTPVIKVGPVSLINGRIFFSDRFVKPNYSVNLSALTGKLSAFSSVAPQGAPQLADLELRGRAEGTASLEILGKLNPLAKPLALDITAKMNDLELPPLSPYSVKYAGYGMERGKLSVSLGYRVSPNGTLTATNNVVLNQLTFGDKVASAPKSLPVKLAVALLADRHGVIDISLPVTGSLNDPQFSLGGVIGKLIVNLITKAVTAPFSMLASALGGGGEELSVVAFAPGSADLSAAAQAGLNKVAQALADRPALKMKVVGTSNLEAEREGYKKERLRDLLLAEKRRSVLVAGGDGAAVMEVTDAESPALLKAVYKRADFPKLRNALGIAQDLPDQEMQALLLANIAVSEDAMRELAVERGVVVKDYLAGKQLPLDRLFLGAAKPVSEDGQWTPRADLSLSAD